MRILIMDEVTVKPGKSTEYRAAWQTGYRPAAERRGMTLEAAWQTPPIEDVAGVPITLVFVWSVEDTAGWWAQRMSKLPDGSDERFEKLAWWESVAPMTIARRRRMLRDLPEAA